MRSVCLLGCDVRLDVKVLSAVQNSSFVIKKKTKWWSSYL